MLAFAKASLLVTSTLALVATPALERAPWEVDANHTRVGFSVRHFFTPVQGSFGDYTVTLDWNDQDPTKSQVEARIAVASINTGNEKRDGHVRSADFFNAEAHQAITFRSTSVRQVAPGKLVASGPLTIKGITKQVDLPITVLGVQEIPAQMQAMLGGAKRVASFEAELKIDRRDFEVGTGSWGETAVVGADVTIQIHLEAMQK